MAGLVFAAVARGQVILVSHQSIHEDFETSCASVLPQIPQYNTRTAYSYGGYDFLILVEEGLIYLCACKPSFTRRLGFSFLNEIKVKFTADSLPFRAINARQHEFDRDFRSVLELKMDKFNRGEGDTVVQLNQKVEEVKGIMRDNIEKVLERGDKLDTLIDKTESLETSASQFRGTARKVRRKMWCKNVKMWFILILVVAVIITVIVLLATNVIPVKSKSDQPPAVTDKST